MATVTENPTTIAQAGRGDLSERELFAWRGLLRAHSALVKMLDAELEQAHDLPLTSYEVLMNLWHSDARRMRMCDLAESVFLSRSGLTRLVDRLERDGLVARVSCETDARGAFAELTPEGIERLTAARDTHLAGVRAHFLDHFSAADLDQLSGFWERIAPGSATSGGDCGGSVSAS